jgi:hypothetical protein
MVPINNISIDPQCYRVIHKSVKHFKKFAVNKLRNGKQILLHWNTENLTIFFFFFFSYFTDAQCVHIWLYGRHLHDNPFLPTRVSAYHGLPDPQQQWYCCFLAANHGSSARGLSLKNTYRGSVFISPRIIMTCCVLYLLQIFLNVSRTYE